MTLSLKTVTKMQRLEKNENKALILIFTLNDNWLFFYLPNKK